MSETMTASQPDAQGHTQGLETGPGALPDTSGAQIEGRGWEDMNGLREAVPPDGKTLHEIGEHQYTPVEEDLGETAVEGTDVTVPEAVEAEMAANAEDIDSGIDTIQVSALAEEALEPGKLFGRGFELTTDDKAEAQSLVDVINADLEPHTNDPEWNTMQDLLDDLNNRGSMALNVHKGTNVSDMIVDGGPDAEVKIVARTTFVDQHGNSTEIKGVQVPSRVFELENIRNTARAVEKTINAVDVKGMDPKPFGRNLQRLVRIIDEAQLPVIETPPASTEEAATQQAESPIEMHAQGNEEAETKALSGYDKAKARYETGENPYAGLSKEEFKTVLRELQTFWDEKIKQPHKSGQRVDREVWDEFDEKHWLVIYALWDEGLDENRLNDEIEYEDAQTRNEAKLSQAEEAAEEEQDTDQPDFSGTEVVEYENPESPEEAARQLLKKQAQPPEAPAAQAEAAAQAAAANGFEQSGAFSPTQVAKKTAGATESAPEVTQKEHSEESSAFAETLGEEDGRIWEDILRINKAYEDGAVTESLEKLQSDPTPDNANLVIQRALISAERRKERGDGLGERQQKVLARRMAELTEHRFGKPTSLAA